MKLKISLIFTEVYEHREPIEQWSDPYRRPNYKFSDMTLCTCTVTLSRKNPLYVSKKNFSNRSNVAGERVLVFVFPEQSMLYSC